MIQLRCYKRAGVFGIFTVYLCSSWWNMTCGFNRSTCGFNRSTCGFNRNTCCFRRSRDVSIIPVIAPADCLYNHSHHRTELPGYICFVSAGLPNNVRIFYYFSHPFLLICVYYLLPYFIDMLFMSFLFLLNVQKSMNGVIFL